ncbi:hypothetical protein RHMOL_Rhmol10G0157300 [Rhododendron molle]|uniref:Uncharacterized protein n=1 Tax=Rhododendron molle TaxID=49168 RepID=A0ACC0M3Q5_RHOML|nr:hypothetical protein RHMOL_Rhmol10G0157300 [Rhododendron molle]
MFRNKVWDLEETIDLVQTRMAIWVKGIYDVKDYFVDDFKRCLDGIRLVKI